MLNIAASTDATTNGVVFHEDLLEACAREAVRFLREDTRSYTGKGEIEDRPHGYSKPFHPAGSKNLAPNILRLTAKGVVIYGQGLQHFINEVNGDQQTFGLSADDIQTVCEDAFDDMVTKFNIELMDNGLEAVTVSLADLTRQVTHPAGRGRWNNRFASSTLKNMERLGLWDCKRDPQTQRFQISPGPLLYAFYDHVYEPLVSEMLTELGLV